MENINLIPEIVWNNTGINLKINKIPHLNKSNATDFVQAFMDKESIERIQEMYAIDFKLYKRAI